MAKRLVELNLGKFSANFTENKKVLDEMKLFDDKSVRNKVAGYIINVVEKKKIK
jgi:ribosomal protein S17E